MHILRREGGGEEEEEKEERGGSKKCRSLAAMTLYNTRLKSEQVDTEHLNKAWNMAFKEKPLFLNRLVSQVKKISQASVVVLHWT